MACGLGLLPNETTNPAIGAARYSIMETSVGNNRNYLLGVLLVVLVFNKIDGVALGLLMQEIKVDLQLSDTALGFLSGIAFALFYSVMGIPIARWADRGDRVAVISATTALWSVGVALCALAGNFLQLLLIRIGVAVGEAGCIPTAHSLIADHFSRAERPRAIARYMLGWPISYGIGYFLAGWLNELYGWRATFVLIGLPGLALAALVRLTLNDPRKKWDTAPPSRSSIGTSVSAPSLKQVCRTLWASIAFRHLLFGFSVSNLFGYGLWQWKPAFFIRTYGLGTGEVGVWLGIIYGVSGVLGMYWGGELASRHAAHDERLQLRAIAAAFPFFGIVSAGMCLAPNHYLAFGLLAIATTGMYGTQGPLFATIQTLVPPPMRAMATALIYLFANLIGMGLGPLLAGALSDVFRPLAAEESLRYALLALCPGYLWAAWHVWRASGAVAGDLRSMPRGDGIYAAGGQELR